MNLTSIPPYTPKTLCMWLLCVFSVGLFTCQSNMFACESQTCLSVSNQNHLFPDKEEIKIDRTLTPKCDHSGICDWKLQLFTRSIRNNTSNQQKVFNFFHCPNNSWGKVAKLLVDHLQNRRLIVCHYFIYLNILGNQSTNNSILKIEKIIE